MSEAREEYTAETYPSFGKKYKGEKAIISMTSWKMRILTCSKTIYSLLKQCPGFHIVLVLSEEEFPKMMDELPDNLKLFVDNELIEVLWVYRNYRSFKKVLFTMDKYRDVPVISADDDCIYTCNYAQELYDTWVKNSNCVITYKRFYFNNHYFQHGPATCYPPYIIDFSKINIMDFVKDGGDDVLIGYILERKNVKIIEYKKEVPYKFHDCIKPLSVHEFTVEKYYSIVKEKLKNVKI